MYSVYHVMCYVSCVSCRVSCVAFCVFWRGVRCVRSVFWRSLVSLGLGRFSGISGVSHLYTNLISRLSIQLIYEILVLLQ